MTKLTKNQRELLEKAPDDGLTYEGDPDDVVELYERGLIALTSIGFDRYLYKRTPAGRLALQQEAEP